MRIAIDAMGGDNAPGEIIAGALESIDLLTENDELILVGPEDTIKTHLPSRLSGKAKISIVHAPDIITMGETPIESLRKKPKSSIAVIAKLAKRDQADAVISAGNTGACVAAFQMRIRNLPGINRPGIAVVFPTPEGQVTICDVGANIACKPIHLYQYGVMGSIYSKNLLKIDNPRVGIMNIGSEEAKGNEIVKKAREMFKADSRLNFIGNIEGRDIFQGTCDVVVCEGFVGNVILKLTEALVDGLFKAIKYELMEEKLRLAMKFKPVMMRIYKKYDYNEYGGALLLGINGTALICHGSSKSRTIKNAILASKRFYTEKINDKIIDYISSSQLCGSAQDANSRQPA
ncbi:MAG: phosphate acyltransferase PlsX [Sedimentisphaerales bacterium]|nr:phosphate acyltransferase PlsX [Sedimentisphaerales bacterium]